MTIQELGASVYGGRILIAGQLRAAKAERSGYVDRKTGIAMKTIRITYFLEIRGSRIFDIVKVTRSIPDSEVDPAQMPLGVEEGRYYAFEVEHFERKGGWIAARMVGIEAEAIEAEGPPPAPPSGGAGAGTPR